MKKWKMLSESRIKNQESGVKDLIKVLLENRGLKTKKEIEEFLNPKLENITIKNVGIDNKQLQKAINRIKSAIKNKEKVVVFGDYDVDGICGTAILWETLHGLGADVMPYIPHRVDEGYGLSIVGISKIKNQKSKIQDVKLIVTVDNGIVANKAVELANKEGIDIVITDHHVPSNPSTRFAARRAGSGLPKAQAIVHTTKLCGAGVAWMLAREIENRKLQIEDSNGKWKMENGKFLELVALATIADLVPLVGANRTFVKFGLERLRQTKRIGLLELFKEAGLNQSAIGVYEVGHIIAPRLNAMGRLEYAMDSLRLLCTNNKKRAEGLAQVLGSTNRERQTLTVETTEHAKSKIQSRSNRDEIRNLLFVAEESYQQGVIGLVAGKLVDEFYRPAIVVSVGEKYSKASARSVSGFNIIEFIRSASELLIDAGGHPMAAGFTVETEKLSILQKTLEDKADALLDEEKLTRTLRIDCELALSSIDENLYQEIQKLAPFGMGNPEPTFVSRAVTIEDIRVVGKEGSHLKLIVSQKTISSRHSGEGAKRRLQNLSSSFMVEGDSGQARLASRAKRARMTGGFDAIAFGMGERANEFRIGDKVDVVYTIAEDTWNGNERLQLKIKDMRNAH